MSRTHWVALLAMASLTLGVRLGSSSRLTYHEAHVAQQASEIARSGDWLVPSLGGQPWLEKPPLLTWSMAGIGRLRGGLDEFSARLPAAAAAFGLAIVVARLAARRLGNTIGLLAGLVQLTMSWTVLRGRLAEVDIVLALLVTAAVAAFDELRTTRSARWAFFVLLGMTALAKGVGFGAVLVLAAVAVVLAWDRDRATLRALCWPMGWALAALIGLTWPLLVLARHPEAWDLWTMHTLGRLSGGKSMPFAGEPWGGYLLSLLSQTAPWAPLALLGAWRSWGRAKTQRGGLDRLLWAWAVVPAVLVSLSKARNGHYLIHALPPWSMWTALCLARVGERLQARGWTSDRVRRSAFGLFALCGLVYAIAYGFVVEHFDRRGEEWGWYAVASRAAPADQPLVLLYDDWDRDPYPTPFGPMPHDLAVRLFYLDRPAECRFSPEGLERDVPEGPFAVIGRDRDRPTLERLGHVTELARGPVLRQWRSKIDDRAFVLFQVTPGPERLGANEMADPTTR